MSFVYKCESVVHSALNSVLLRFVNKQKRPFLTFSPFRKIKCFDIDLYFVGCASLLASKSGNAN